MARLGERLGAGLQQVAADHGLPVTVSGPLALPYMTFDEDKEGLPLSQVFCREMISRGIFLHPYHNWFLCAAHTEADIDHILEAANAAFEVTEHESRGIL
jgi:glutamate-1-semialdehyde 2,1-aminomutase